MTARTGLRRAAGLVAAYAIALQAIFASSVLAASASVSAPPESAIVCSSADSGGAAVPPARGPHDCASACIAGGCGGGPAGSLPSFATIAFADPPQTWHAADAAVSRQSSVTSYAARSPPVA